MAGSAHHHVIHDLGDRGTAFWLPPGGWGSGLTDQSWVQLAEVTSDLAANVILLEFGEAVVPGYAARLRPPRRTNVRRGYRDVQRIRIWVGCSAYGRGETTLIDLLPRLNARLGGHVIA